MYKLPQVVEYENRIVLTTEQLAEVYGTETNNIQMNFSRNKNRFFENKHYYFLEGENLKTFKSSLPTESGLPLKFAPTLYLWTERGASRHSKILDTDKAWEMFDILEENYFNPKFKNLKMYDLNGESCTNVKHIAQKHGCSFETVREYLMCMHFGEDYTYLMGHELKAFKIDNVICPNISCLYLVYPSGIAKIEAFIRRFKRLNSPTERVLELVTQ